MESCYIPNNPQFGLSLEYSGYGGAFNGTITGFSSGCEPEGILCCGGPLQDCGNLDCVGGSCHLDEHCGDQLNTIEDLNGDRIVGCDDHLQQRDDRLIDTSSHISLKHLHNNNNNNNGLESVDCDDSDDRRLVETVECDNGGLDDRLVEHRLDDFDSGCGGTCDNNLCTGEDQPSGNSGVCWNTEDMGSFSLPPLDLDPLPSLFPFSPCNYKGEIKEKQPHEVADVLLSLKHAVVHPGAELGSSYSQQELHPQVLHPQMVMGGGGCYDPCPSGVFPTMSVNVSMNMTMHGYPPDQMCPQMQWGQNPPTSPMNVMYSQSQGMISPAPYPSSATYSFTADFRPQPQSDPLITATTSFKPIQITNQKSVSNYANVFSHKPPPPPPSHPNYSTSPTLKPNGSGQMKTRSCSKLQLAGEHHAGPPSYLLQNNQLPMQPNGYNYPCNNNNMVAQNGGKVQIGSLSGCSGSDDEQKPNLCRICGKTYARPSTLKTHLRTHSGERPYRCSDCNKSFSQAANLTAHVRTHTGQKPFRCPICDRRFSQSSSVTTHMRTHSGERPYRCRACKKAFSDSSTLTKHLRIHSGEKPYQCKLCLLRFSQSGNLNRHMRVHGNNAALLG